MYFDAMIDTSDLGTMGPTAAAAERVGFDAIWTTETKHDPFLPLVPAALSTSRISMGTAIALAFPRSPMVTAYTAWDLAKASQNRFILGLGTQVKAHIERRYSTAWDAPVARLRDYIAALRATWSTWQTGERLRYTGDFYTLKLMTPFFTPEPLPYPAYQGPPIFIAGVNKGLCVLAGEVCQGFHIHPLHTARYLREAVLPWIQEGLEKSGRERGDIQLAASEFVIVGKGEARDRLREDVRRQISFYASTPTYRTQMDLHGWGEQAETLTALAGRGRWDDMAALISDEMLAEFSVEGDTLADAARAVKERYEGLVDRTAFYIPFTPGERDDEWAEAARVIGDRG